jgi:hypothetical protein
MCLQSPHKRLLSFKILDVGINNIEKDVFGICIHFLYMVNGGYGFW